MTSKPQITQAMIEAYDEYTHLTLDRRKLMKRLTALTGSGAAAAAILPLIAADSSVAQMVAPDDDRIDAQDVSFEGETGTMNAYLVRPANTDDDLPSVVVIHENRGLNPHIQDVARRMALEGFNALAVDFLSPLGGTPEDEDQARNMFGELNSAETTANAVAAVDYLQSLDGSNGNVGAVGFCWGGGLVNALAVASPELKAGVAYYGRQASAEDVPDIEAALMLHYAGLDERINAGIDAYREALEEHDKDYTIHIYEGVNHAFNNDTSQARYDEEAANLAWQRTVAFFNEQLG
jgi:carboxymethylenebutenolidase